MAGLLHLAGLCALIFVVVAAAITLGGYLLIRVSASIVAKLPDDA